MLRFRLPVLAERLSFGSSALNQTVKRRFSQKLIREYSGKKLIKDWMIRNNEPEIFAKSVSAGVLVSPETDLKSLENPFGDAPLVAKPDQLVKRRGKLGLLSLNKQWADQMKWLDTTRGTELTIGEATRDVLKYFLVEEFVPHKASEEQYVCIHSVDGGDEILFYHEGGVDVGDIDAKASRLLIPPMETPTEEVLTSKLLGNLADNKRPLVSKFLQSLYRMYAELNFAYLEINPVIVTDDLKKIGIVDLAAKLDSTAEHLCHHAWKGVVDFPPHFGASMSPEEETVQRLDDASGASLKLSVLNPDARIWTMVAGGGASVIYADTICDLGFAGDLGNYGEYSGDPSTQLTYGYANTIIDLATRNPHPDGKVLLIGGGIANFTDVADTFKGVIQALEENQEKLKANNTKIYVRRGGPNYQTGLKMMRECAENCGLDMQVYGPESHLTDIVRMALGTQSPEDIAKEADAKVKQVIDNVDLSNYKWNNEWSPDDKPDYVMTNNTTSIVFGMQNRAVQNMLDFDYISGRKEPSVSSIVYEFQKGKLNHRQFYWGAKEVMVPIYNNMSDCLTEFPNVDTVVNFASSRSAYDATMRMMDFDQIKHVTIIAEGVPERQTKELIKAAKEKDVFILGPSTVGGIKSGCFRIGNTAGSLDNVIDCGLHQPGSVAFVSRSGGLSNEMASIVGRSTDGVLEGMAVGGDRFPTSNYMDHLLRYQADPKCKLMVLLGEVGGALEYEVCEAVKDGRLTKPIVAWCTGTCAGAFSHEVQFGHAGASAQSNLETATAKNEAMANAGILVPDSFDDFARYIKFMYERLRDEKVLTAEPRREPPPVPVDYNWARKLGLVRKPASFLSSISDDRGEELTYAGMPISQVFEQNLGIGGVVGLLWFKRQLPDYGTKFIEAALMITADHGPAVSGAHNSIVTARAGKDLVSSLCAGLLTIGPRFGGALDGAAQMFTEAYDAGLSPEEFVKKTRTDGKVIMGIGHKVKSLDNPDKRVEIILDFVRKHFPKTPIVDYACQVQLVTTRKKSNLILNVDGAIAVAFVDLLRNSGSFTPEEAEEYIKMGSLNALFVLGRSIGFVGHYLDQNRMKQGLYRHPTDDITYFLQQQPTKAEAEAKAKAAKDAKAY